MAMFGVGQDDLAVHPRDVAGQAVAAACGVDAAQHVPTEAGGGQRGQHVRRVAHQDAHVQRAIGVGAGDQRGGLGASLGKVFAPRPRPVAVLDRESVVPGPLAEQLLERVRHGGRPRSH